MTVYLFVLNTDTIKSTALVNVAEKVEISGKTYLLYAYTNKKKFAKFFKQSRDINKFILFELDMTDDRYKEFNEEYFSNELIIRKMVTKSKSSLNNPEVRHVLCTEAELDVSVYMPDYVFVIVEAIPLFDNVELNALPFNKKIYKTLLSLGIISLECMINDSEDYTLSDSDAILDELEVFITEFGDSIVK